MTALAKSCHSPALYMMACQLDKHRECSVQYFAIMYTETANEYTQ
jgi:hypothetical protein